MQRHPGVVAVLGEQAGQSDGGRGVFECDVLPEDRGALGDAEARGQREPVEDLPVADDLVVVGPERTAAIALSLLGFEASPSGIDESLGFLEPEAVALENSDKDGELAKNDLNGDGKGEYSMVSQSLEMADSRLT